MMKKTALLLLQVFLVFISCSCLIGNLVNQPQPDSTSPDQLPSDFDLWAQGIMPSIRLESGQENLTNYREEFHIQISGEDETGASVEAFHDYLIEIDKAADTQHEIENMQTPSEYLTGVYEWVTMDGATYYVHDEVFLGGRICEKEELPADTSHFSDVHVTRQLQDITPGELLEKDVRVNDVLADVYEIKDLSLLFLRTLNKVSGKVWIAQQPAYFLKAEGEIEGVFEFENRLYTSNATFTYEIKDFDQVSVQLPALCAYPPEEMIPLPANATEVQKSPPYIFFSSPDPWDQVTSFYTNGLTSQGWQVTEGSSYGFKQVLQASITTQQGIQIQTEIKISDMPDGSRVQITWQAK
jgi:hypothetical protein